MKPYASAIRAARTAALGSLLVVLAGCSNLLTSRSAAPVTYVLRPTFTAVDKPLSASNGATAAVQLAAVEVAAGYATADILATRPGRILDIFAASRWADELPRMLGGLALEALAVSGGVDAYPTTAAVATTHVLQLTVRRFDAEYQDEGAAPTIRVILDAVVTRRADRQAIGNFTVDIAVPATANRMTSIVAGFEKAAGGALEQVARSSAAVIGAAADRHRNVTASP